MVVYFRYGRAAYKINPSKSCDFIELLRLILLVSSLLIKHLLWHHAVISIVLSLLPTILYEKLQKRQQRCPLPPQKSQFWVFFGEGFSRWGLGNGVGEEEGKKSQNPKETTKNTPKRTKFKKNQIKNPPNKRIKTPKFS